ncbi:hypothetical protein K2Z84_10750 [Candidatus Binatia bacterium]|nr:hypothetical protein [Candidatus Binatia bacterium]
MRQLIAALILVWWMFQIGARVGFCPMDEGLVLAQAHRLLLGQTPHIDFITPRPALSAVLHLGDLALPLPTFLASRLVALLQITTYSTVLASLVFRRNPRQWTLVQFCAWGCALLLNVHGFPLMAWYTIDGILLVAAGFALVDRDATDDRLTLAMGSGLVLLGAAPLTKQSFFAAPLVGALMLWTRAHGRPLGERVRSVARGVSITAIPGLLYAGIVAARGGSAAMVQQLLGAQATWGAVLLGPFLAPGGRQRLLALVAMLAVTSACDAQVRRGVRGAQAAILAALALRLALSVMIVAPAIEASLTWQLSGWGVQIWCVVLVVCAWRMILERALDRVALLLLLLGWMTSLSWGYANPNLVIGSIALAGVWSLWRAVPAPPVAYTRAVGVAAAGLSLLALVVTARSFAVARSLPYFDRPAAEAVVDLGRVSPALAGIRGNPTTAAFLEDITTCIARHPARRVAVVPDNAWVYPALGLDDPLPLDWLYPPEYRSDSKAILRRTRTLAREGDYLVLFQPLPAHLVCRYDGPLPPAGVPFVPGGYGDGLPLSILTKLAGRNVRCGSVWGVWKPAVAAGLPDVGRRR